MPERIGFIGLGIMGKPMVRNLVKDGHQLVVHNRSRDDVDEIVAELGDAVIPAASPREVAEQASTGIVITMLPDSPDVRNVVFGEDGLLDAMPDGGLLIDMSTISPATAIEVNDALRQRGASAIDAPVSGGDRGAIAGTLSSADRERVRRSRRATRSSSPSTTRLSRKHWCWRVRPGLIPKRSSRCSRAGSPLAG
jgi:2-hydroxy-3-oxopropionate reductase